MSQIFKYGLLLTTDGLFTHFIEFMCFIKRTIDPIDLLINLFKTSDFRHQNVTN